MHQPSRKTRFRSHESGDGINSHTVLVLHARLLQALHLSMWLLFDNLLAPKPKYDRILDQVSLNYNWQNRKFRIRILAQVVLFMSL